MNSDVKGFIESGILEMYVLGATTAEETNEVARMAVMHDDVRKEIEAISNTVENYTRANAIEPDPTLKPFIWATIRYMERMQHGEVPASPPALHLGSRMEDYAEWLKQEDLQLDEPLEDAYAHIIGYTPEVTTAIVWLKYGSPPETHTKELEKFLVVEGSCEITIGNDLHKMNPGGVLIIPLHISHHVRVTSAEPCKIILQRMAA